MFELVYSRRWGLFLTLTSLCIVAQANRDFTTPQPQHLKAAVERVEPSKNQRPLSLTTAVERTLSANPATRKNWIEVKIRAMQVKMAHADYYPKVDGSLDYSHNKSKTQYNSQPELNSTASARQYNLAVNANWLIFDFGQRQANVKQAEAMLEMAFAQQQQQMQELMLQTITAYYDVMRLQMSIESQNRVVVDAEQNFLIAQARYNAGAAIKADQLQMQANWAKARADLTRLKGQTDIAMGRLATLMGSPVDTHYVVPVLMETPDHINLKPIQALIDQALVNHPKLKETQASIAASRQNIKAIQRERYPRLSLQSSYLRNGSNNTGTNMNSYNQTLDQGQIGLQVTFPLMDGFSRRHRQAEAEYNLDLRLTEQEQVKYDLLFNIWDKYYSLMAENENLQALQLLQHSAEEANKVTVGRYKAGVGEMLEVLNAQRILSDANMNYATSMTQFMVLKFELLSSLGTLSLSAQ